MRSSLVTIAALLLAFSLPGTPPSPVLPAAEHDHQADQAPAEAPPAMPQATSWGATYFPNVPLVTQDGKPVRFYEDLLKGKKVLMPNLRLTKKDVGDLIDYLQARAAAFEGKEAQNTQHTHPERPQTAAAPTAPGGETVPAHAHHHHAGEEK